MRSADVTLGFIDSIKAHIIAITQNIYNLATINHKSEYISNH
jgi:hypothetical protein